MKQLILTEQERTDLLRLEKAVTGKKQLLRIRVILALDRGYTTTEVADILLLDEDTVSHCKQKFLQRQYVSDWLTDTYHPYTGKLTAAEEQEVAAYVEREVVTDSKQVVAYLEEHFGKGYSVDGATKRLHRLGFVYKQVTLTPGKADPVAQQQFVQQYEQLQATKKPDEVILFGDGVHPTHNVHPIKAWVKAGTEKQVKTNTGRQRLNINGALNRDTLEVVSQVAKTLNTATTLAFFDQIQASYPAASKITLILDNARYYKNHNVQTYLDQPECRLVLLFLPPYSPNLNLIERLWKFLKKYIIGTTYRATFAEFEQAIRAFLAQIASYHDRLTAFLGKKLHLLPLAA